MLPTLRPSRGPLLASWHCHLGNAASPILRLQHSSRKGSTCVEVCRVDEIAAGVRGSDQGSRSWCPCCTRPSLKPYYSCQSVHVNFGSLLYHRIRLPYFAKSHGAEAEWGNQDGCIGTQKSMMAESGLWCWCHEGRHGARGGRLAV